MIVKQGLKRSRHFALELPGPFQLGRFSAWLSQIKFFSISPENGQISTYGQPMEAKETKGSVETVAPEIHLTAKDWATRSGLPYRTLLSAIKAGELVAYRVAGTTRGSLYVSAEDFRSWLDSCRVQPVIPTKINRRDYYTREKSGRQLDRRLERIRKIQAEVRK